LQNGGTIEHVQQIAAHGSSRATKLYDRTNVETFDAISLDERACPAVPGIERMRLGAILRSPCAERLLQQQVRQR
jgi:hypothetical protein